MYGAPHAATPDPVVPDRETHTSKVRPSQALELGLDYLTGHNVPRDPVRAAQFLQQAAEAGVPEAQTRLGMMYQTGTGVSRDFSLAMHWYQLAAASGGLAAKVNMATLYARGNGVPRDSAMALQMFHQAFEMGYGAAAAYLGEMYFAGTGVARDRKAAEDWFTKGMKKHDPVSAYDLGILNTGEYGHKPDLPRAADMLRKAAKVNYVPAEYCLGLLIARHPDFGTSDEARTWLDAASEAGFWKADAVLGILSRDGDGVAKDPEKALYYFRLAVAQGGDSALKLLGPDLKVLAARISPERAGQIADTAVAWAKSHPPLFLIVNSATGDMTIGGSLGNPDSPEAAAPQPAGGHPPRV
ncbi:MAG TPA: tetratricopeptide repeat protein [Terracidiphilus sp.]|jgi:hypothetical protein